jgi:hypothetical protein
MNFLSLWATMLFKNWSQIRSKMRFLKNEIKVCIVVVMKIKHVYVLHMFYKNKIVPFLMLKGV